MRDRIWIVVPAAGASRRLARHVPKQHLEIAGRSLLEHALAPLLAHPSVAGGVGFLKVTLRTPVALQAIEAIAHDVDAAIVGRGRF